MVRTDRVGIEHRCQSETTGNSHDVEQIVKQSQCVVILYRVGIHGLSFLSLHSMPSVGGFSIPIVTI